MSWFVNLKINYKFNLISSLVLIALFLLAASLTYQRQQCHMEPGDLLVLYSDGVTEATNPAGEEFEDRLPVLAAQFRHRSAAEVVQAIHEAVKEWIAGQPPADDVTVVVARRAS